MQQGVLDDVSENGHCRYYPETGYLIEDRQAVKALQWLPYIGLSMNNVTHAGKERRFICLGYQILNSTTTVQKRGKSLSTLGAFGICVDLRPIDISPPAAGMKRLKRG